MGIFYYNLDNEIANEYWEFKLPKGFKRPTEDSSPAEVWQFIQNKYVKKLYAPKKVADPATEFKENLEEDSSKKKSKTPPTDDDSIKSIKKKAKKKEDTPVVIKDKPAKLSAIDDLLDIDIENNDKAIPTIPIASTVKVKSENLWDIIEPKPVNTSIPAPSKTNAPVNISFTPVNFYARQQANKYAAFDQLPYVPPYNTNINRSLMYNQSSNFTAKTPNNFGFEVKPEKSKLDNAFAGLLPDDF